MRLLFRHTTCHHPLHTHTAKMKQPPQKRAKPTPPHKESALTSPDIVGKILHFASSGQDSLYVNSINKLFKTVNDSDETSDQSVFSSISRLQWALDCGYELNLLCPHEAQSLNATLACADLDVMLYALGAGYEGPLIAGAIHAGRCACVLDELAVVIDFDVDTILDQVCEEHDLAGFLWICRQMTEEQRSSQDTMLRVINSDCPDLVQAAVDGALYVTTTDDLLAECMYIENEESALEMTRMLYGLLGEGRVDRDILFLQSIEVNHTDLMCYYYHLGVSPEVLSSAKEAAEEEDDEELLNWFAAHDL